MGEGATTADKMWTKKGDGGRSWMEMGRGWTKVGNAGAKMGGGERSWARVGEGWTKVAKVCDKIWVEVGQVDAGLRHRLTTVSWCGLLSWEDTRPRIRTRLGTDAAPGNTVHVRSERGGAWGPRGGRQHASSFHSPEWSISNFPYSLTRNILLHTVWRTWLFITYLNESWLLGYQFSLPHLYITLWKVRRMYFLNLGVKGLSSLLCWSPYWPARRNPGIAGRPESVDLGWTDGPADRGTGGQNSPTPSPPKPGDKRHQPSLLYSLQFSNHGRVDRQRNGSCSSSRKISLDWLTKQ